MSNAGRVTLVGLLLLSLTVTGDALSWAQARFVHAAPLAAERSETNISLYIAGDFSVGGFPHSYQLQNIVYRNYTNFFGYPAADFDIVIRSGSNGSKLVDTTITMESGHAHWIIFTGDGQHRDFDIQVVRAVLPAWDSGQHALRFVHAAPVADNAPAASLAIRDVDGGLFAPDLDGLVYGQISADVYIPPGEAQFVVHAGDLSGRLLRPVPMQFEALTQATALLVIGDEVNQPLSMLAVPGGELGMLELDEEDAGPEVDNSVLGWWDTANTAAGEGLLLQPLPDQQRLVGTIYTYADDDSGDQRWYVLESCRPFDSGTGDCPALAGFDGRLARATVFSTKGARLGGSQPSILDVAGWIELEFFDCDQGLAYMTLNDGSTVTWELQRLTRTVPCTLD